MGTSQPQFEALLATEDDVDIVTRVTRRSWHGGQIVVVANGSFLLNLPLVNHEHRKLADKLNFGLCSCRKNGVSGEWSGWTENS